MEGVADELQEKHPSEVVNMVWDKEGRCRSRYGYTNVNVPLANISAPFDTISDGTNVFTWGVDMAVSGTNERNTAPLVEVSQVANLASGLDMNYCDSSVHTNHLATAYDYTATTGTSYIEIHSAHTDGTSPKFVAEATANQRRPKVVHVNSGSNVLVVSEDSVTAANLKLNRFATSASSSTSSTPITDYGGNHFATTTDDTVGYVAYGSNANRLTVRKINASGTVTGTYTHATDDADAVDICYESAGGSLYVVYDDTAGNVKVVEVDPSAMTQSSTNTPFTAGTHDRVTITTTTTFGSATVRLLAFRCDDSSALETEVRGLATGLGSMGTAHTVERVIIQGKAFAYTDTFASGTFHRALCVVSEANAHPLQPHLVLCEFNEDVGGVSGSGAYGYAGCVPLAVLAHDAAYTDITSGGTYVGMHGTEESTGKEFYTTCRYQTGFGAPATAGAINPVWGVRTYKLDFTRNPHPGYALFENAAYTIGGLPIRPSPALAGEASIIGQPTITSSTLAAGALTGDYSWRAVWELTGADGTHYRSAPSDEETQTLSTQQNTLTITAPRFGWDFTDSLLGSQAYTLAIYRTKAGGSIFFLLDRIKVEPGPNTGNATTGLISYIDNKADNILTTGQVLRHGIAGGDLAPLVPPSSQYIFPWRDRLCIISAENPTEVWYSKPSARNMGPEWNPTLSWLVPDKAVGGVQLNNSAVIFSLDRIYACSGSLGNAAGNGQNIAVQEVNSTLGCVRKQSIIHGLAGVYFESKRGLELLKPDFNVEFVGRPIQDTLDGQTISSAVLDPSTDSVVWCLKGTTKMLRLNETNGNWSVDDIDSTLTDSLHTIRTHNRLLYGAGSLSSTHTEAWFKADTATRGADTDSTSTKREFESKVVTPWFRLTDVQGFQDVDKITILGKMAVSSGTSRAIQTKVFHDYSDTASSTHNHTLTGLSASLSNFQVQLRPTQTHCQAIRFQISVVGDQTFATDFVLTNLELEVGVERGLARLAAGSNK